MHACCRILVRIRRDLTERCLEICSSVPAVSCRLRPCLADSAMGRRHGHVRGHDLLAGRPAPEFAREPYCRGVFIHIDHLHAVMKPIMAATTATATEPMAATATSTAASTAPPEPKKWSKRSREGFMVRTINVDFDQRHDPQLRIGPSMPIILQMCAPKHATFV